MFIVKCKILFLLMMNIVFDKEKIDDSYLKKIVKFILI